MKFINVGLKEKSMYGDIAYMVNGNMTCRILFWMEKCLDFIYTLPEK
jgi:hypothetical protein